MGKEKVIGFRTSTRGIKTRNSKTDLKETDIT